MLILPALHVLFSPWIFGEPADQQIHHMYMAAGMAVNVAVSLPAALRHHREGAVRVPTLATLITTNAIAVIVGVLLSNLFPGETLRLLLGITLVLYCIWNFKIIIRPNRRPPGSPGRIENSTTPRLATAGAGTGVVGGLLGLGGGFLLVPLLQLLCNMRLKNAIATSSAVLCITAAIGAALKFATLSQQHESPRDALSFALFMAPTAAGGALLGARLLHVMPVTAVRVVMTVLALAAATKMLY